MCYTSIQDRLDTTSWDQLNERINLEEHEKFEYDQKVNIINNALEREGKSFYVDPENKRLFDFVKKFEPVLTPETKELKGFNYNGKEIIRRRYKDPNNRKEGYQFEFQNNDTADQVIEQLGDISDSSFRDKLIAKIGDTKNIKLEAENYIEELRNIQKERIENATKIGELKERIKQINRLNEDIQNIKENKPVVIDENVLEKSLKGRVASFLKKYKIPIVTTALQSVFGVVGAVLTTLGVGNSLHKGAKKIAQLRSLISKSGKTIQKIGKTMEGITKYPVKTLASILQMFGYLVEETSLNPVLLVSLIAVLIVIYIIKYGGR